MEMGEAGDFTGKFLEKINLDLMVIYLKITILVKI
jgi:hypothetical protein